VPVPPESTSTLLQLQRSMAQGLRENADVAATDAPRSPPGDAVVAAPGWAIYRNNARQFFRTALAATYPVLQRRVGDDFFRQLAHEFRAVHPSRSGDLHDVGREFPAWLQHRLAATPYAWLADLARLEWACTESVVEPRRDALALAALGKMPQDRLDDVMIGLQPSLRLVSSPFAIWSVWQANQDDAPGPAVDVTAGPEHCACACLTERVVVYRIDAGEFALLCALQRGESFATALASTGLGADVLARLLDWAFAEELVVALSLPPP
jgi:hypothetical protein